MARLPKEALDYFPLDCVLDDKVRLIEAEFGLYGFGVVVKLWQKVYGQQGYYIEWTNEVALLFAKDIGLGEGVVSEIISASIKRGIFDSNLFEKHSILTSRRIQKVYFEAVKRRTTVKVKSAYLLVNVDDILKDVSINVIYADINSENVYNNPQSKVEESRVEESKEEKEKDTPKGVSRAHRFIPPSVNEVKSYCDERKNGIDPESFINHYAAKGWVIGKSPMKDWRAAVRTWESRNRVNGGSNNGGPIESGPMPGVKRG